MKSFKAMREDPHCPRLLDPADYVRVGESDQGSDYTHVRHNVLAKHGVETGCTNQYSDQGVPFYDATEDGRPNYRCHHCGKHGSNIRYFIFFLHKPSKRVVVVGQICAKKLALDTREELDRLQLRRDEYLRRQRESRWAMDHPAEVQFLREHAEGDEFLASLLAGLDRFHSLTERQLAALQAKMVRVSREEAEAADRHKAVVTNTEAGITDAQEAFIIKLFGELGSEVPALSQLTRAEASDLINRLKAEVNQRREATEEKRTWRDDPMSDSQRAMINRLMEERSMAPEARRKARQQLDAGLTKGKASEWITRLQGLPEIGEAA